METFVSVSFSSITNFAIDFYIKKLFMTHKMGSFHVIPATEYLYNTLGNDHVPLISSPDEGEEVYHRESDFLKELAGAGAQHHHLIAIITPSITYTIICVSQLLLISIGSEAM